MKKLLALLLALVMVLSLAACGSSEPAATEAPATEAPAPAATEAPATEAPASLLGTTPVEITFWHCASDDAGPLMEKYINEFNANNEYQITVKPVYQGQYSDATKLLSTMISGENYSELPDVMQLDATGKVTYFTSGKAFTVDAAKAAFPETTLEDKYLTGAMGNWQFSGAQLGLPFATSTTVTYANMDLLKQAGWDKAPDTFAEVIQLAADMKAAGMTQIAYKALPNTPTLANWIGQLGSYVVDMSNGADGTATKLEMVDSGALETFLTEWKAMYDAGLPVHEGGKSDEFIAGDVVLYTSSSSSIGSVNAKVNGAFEVGVGPYLRVNDSASYGATVSGSCIVMFDSEDALRKEAAWVFTQYLASADVQADFAAGTGYTPAHLDAMESDVYKALLAEQPAYSVAFDQLSNTPAEMRSVTVGPSTDFYYAIQNCISDMLMNDQSVEETVEIMEEELNGLLYQYLQQNG